MNRLARTVRPSAPCRALAARISLRAASSSSTTPSLPAHPARPSPPTPSPPPPTHSRARPRLRTDLDLSDLDSFPSLLHPDPLLDSALIYPLPPSLLNPYATKVTIHNAVKTFFPPPDEERTEEDDAADFEDESGLADTVASLPLATPDRDELASLHRYPLLLKRVAQMTAKGKMYRLYSLIVAGNGDGLVSYGEGKHEEPAPARDRAFRDAVRGLDRVERFEKRTLWHDVECKFGATRVVLRPRPLGFGLRCGPVMHQVCKAAGIKDISGKIYGSRNPMNVVKATCLALWAGEARAGMGNGIGGGGRRKEKGVGARSRDEIERARGRRLISL